MKKTIPFFGGPQDGDRQAFDEPFVNPLEISGPAIGGKHAAEPTEQPAVAKVYRYVLMLRNNQMAYVYQGEDVRELGEVTTDGAS